MKAEKRREWSEKRQGRERKSEMERKEKEKFLKNYKQC